MVRTSKIILLIAYIIECSDLERGFVIVPRRDDLLVKGLVELISVCVRQDDAFVSGWVADWFDAGLGVLEQVVVALNSSSFFVLHNNFPDRQEVVIDGGELVVPLSRTVHSS